MGNSVAWADSCSKCSSDFLDVTAVSPRHLTEAFAEDRVVGSSDTEVTAGWIGGNHAERDAVWGVFRERHEKWRLKCRSFTPYHRKPRL